MILTLNGYKLLCTIMLSLIHPVNYNIIHRCTEKLKPHRDDEFNGTPSLHLLDGYISANQTIYNVINTCLDAKITHGYNPEDLLLSTGISIPKDNRGSLELLVPIIEVFLLSNSICNLSGYVFIDLNIHQLQTRTIPNSFGFNYIITQLFYRTPVPYRTPINHSYDITIVMFIVVL